MKAASPSLRIAIGNSSLGLILVAASSKGVSVIEIGDDRAALMRDLRQRFPAAQLNDPDAQTNSLLSRVIANIESPAQAVEIPIDIAGTAFQQKVWRALRNIPRGSTTTYAELASAIGHPSAARAVGTACGANPVAVVIPCHRVITSDGRISGYRWGVERKRLLLEREAIA
jgi:AraC family transcriptional regulator of adaptative response/methylated-DNA-[protein]-cysteine methyltransferase